MYIRGLIPRNFAQLAEEVPSDAGVTSIHRVKISTFVAKIDLKTDFTFVVKRLRYCHLFDNNSLISKQILKYL